jgi:hypothetical protein
MQTRWVRILFAVAGVYDGVLGLVFLFIPTWLFSLNHVQPPNHTGYVQFPALLLLVFAVMFFRIAADPVRRKELILYACGLKASYCGIVFFYHVTRGIPPMWLPWAWVDLAFLVLFVLAALQLRSRS